MLNLHVLTTKIINFITSNRGNYICGFHQPRKDFLLNFPLFQLVFLEKITTTIYRCNFSSKSL